MKAKWTKYSLNFKQPAGTSRGVLKQKDSYFIKLEQDGSTGLGECGLLRGLSADDRPDYEDFLSTLCADIQASANPKALLPSLEEWPSVQAGLEMALLDLESEQHILYPSDFTDGYERQAINGLIWMGNVDFMLQQLREKIEQGFLVIKMKIGALQIEDELNILKRIRSQYGQHEIQLRVDANGAFTPQTAPAILDELYKLKIHSIEQPIKAGNWKEMAKLCKENPMPIALDEEVIGVYNREQKIEMLETIKPRFIILKPSFLGGFAKSEEWIDLAESRGIGWWVTSALESNYGLSAIAQWNYNLYGHLASGLGTGSLYTNNFESPLCMIRGTVAFDPKANWDLSSLSF